MQSAMDITGNLQALATRGLRYVLCEAFCIILLMAGSAALRAQQGGSGQFPVTPPHGFPQQDNSPLSSMEGGNPVEAEKRLRAINAERQKSLVADTNRLLALATELNNEIAKSNTGELSAEQLHKVAEIEKLARSVKEKMSMSLRGPAPAMEGPIFLPSPH